MAYINKNNTSEPVFFFFSFNESWKQKLSTKCVATAFITIKNLNLGLSYKSESVSQPVHSELAAPPGWSVCDSDAWERRNCALVQGGLWLPSAGRRNSHMGICVITLGEKTWALLTVEGRIKCSNSPQTLRMGWAFLFGGVVGIRKAC